MPHFATRDGHIHIPLPMYVPGFAASMWHAPIPDSREEKTCDGGKVAACALRYYLGPKNEREEKRKGMGNRMHMYITRSSNPLPSPPFLRCPPYRELGQYSLAPGDESVEDGHYQCVMVGAGCRQRRRRAG